MRQIFKNSILILSLTFSSVLYGQNDYINVRNLPTPDCSGESSIYSKFNWGKKERLLIIPDKTSESEDFSHIFKYYKRSVHDSLIKRESELTPKDLLKSLVIYGVIDDFKNWEKFDVPVRKTPNGFKFGKKEYNNASDGIYYISKNRMIYTGNSAEPIWKQQSAMLSSYKYMIFERGLLSKLCFSDSTIVNLSKIRKTNYNKKSTKYFRLFIDRKLGKVNISDSIVIDICNKMKLELPEFKITGYMHKNPNATRLFSNFYLMAGCDTLSLDDKINTVQFESIHITGKDIETLKHETFHFVWNRLVLVASKYDSPISSFFNEGIQKFYEYLCDSSKIDNSLKIQKKHIDYNITPLVLKGGMSQFWNAPTEDGWTIAYDISGLFVKYLIDNWGLKTFKDFYNSDNIENAFDSYYHMSGDKIIKKYKDWINNFNGN